jgi:hypothetical protein
MRHHLIIVRAGDESLHRLWLRGADRQFDVMVSYYGATPGGQRQRADYYHALPGPRWPGHHALLGSMWDVIHRYDHVAFVCDDIDAYAGTWNELFHWCAWYELDLAQPAILGHVGIDITRPRAECMLRYTNFVEVMTPVFSRRALERVRDTFSESVSGWGLSALWSQRLPYPAFKQAIVDRVRVTHTTPLRQGALRPVLDRLGIDPPAEREQLLARHGLADFTPREVSRLSYVSETA